MEPPRILISGEAGHTRNYEHAISQAGGIPQAGYCPPVDLTCAGLLLCGGGDLDPALYHQENQGSQPPDPVRDTGELALIDAFWKAGKPILGICRGMQILNVALGGSLIQDLSQDLALFHRWDQGDKVHPLRTAPGCFLHTLYGPSFASNSAHHQAVDRLGEDLVPCAWSESGIIEGLQHTTRPILAVQFHPERMTGAHQRPDTASGAAIFQHFLALCQPS